MRVHRHLLSFAVALSLWSGAANAGSPELEEAAALPSTDYRRATWIAVEVRNHNSGASGVATVLFGVAQERGRNRQASLRVLCLDGTTTVHLDVDGLRSSLWVIGLGASLDGSRLDTVFWKSNLRGGSLELSGERAIAFVSALYGGSELRLTILRPLSVPFLLTFAVSNAEPSMRLLAERCHWTSGPALSEGDGKTGGDQK